MLVEQAPVRVALAVANEGMQEVVRAMARQSG